MRRGFGSYSAVFGDCESRQRLTRPCDRLAPRSHWRRRISPKACIVGGSAEAFYQTGRGSGQVWRFLFCRGHVVRTGQGAGRGMAGLGVEWRRGSATERRDPQSACPLPRPPGHSRLSTSPQAFPALPSSARLCVQMTPDLRGDSTPCLSTNRASLDPTRSHHISPVRRTSTMPPEPSDVQGCVLRAFDKLPAKCKPRARDQHAREWVPLAGVVLARTIGTDITRYSRLISPRRRVPFSADAPTCHCEQTTDPR